MIKFTEANIKELVFLYTERQYSLAELAKMHNVNPKVIRRVLSENEVQIVSYRTKVDLPTKEEFLNVLSSGGTSLVSEKYNVSRTTVRNWCSHFGVDISRELTNAEKEKALSLYLSGKTIKQISEEFGTARSTIRRALINSGVDTSRKTVKVPSQADLEALYIIERKSLSSIGTLYGVSDSTVLSWMRKLGMPTRERHESFSPPNKEVLEELYTKKNLSPKEISEILSVSDKTIYKWLDKYSLYDERKYASCGEYQLLDFVNSLGDFQFKKNRTEIGSELDCYSEKLKVAFEYCGLYWHSESVRGKNIHREKLEKCRSKNIRLFTIYETEWNERRNQVKSFIASALGIFSQRIYARNAQVIVHDHLTQEISKFLEDTHIQGTPAKGSVERVYSLALNGETICAIVMGKHHRTRKSGILSRYAVKSGCLVIGGAKRLMSRVMKDYAQIITWSDNRWSEGFLYSHLGFTLTKEYGPDYCYFKNNKIYSKQSMTKKKLQCSDTQTEYQRALELGYDRIWDCGKKKWELKC